LALIDVPESSQKTNDGCFGIGLLRAFLQWLSPPFGQPCSASTTEQVAFMAIGGYCIAFVWIEARLRLLLNSQELQ
jgi:hypothetical protein